MIIVLPFWECCVIRSAHRRPSLRHPTAAVPPMAPPPLSILNRRDVATGLLALCSKRYIRRTLDVPSGPSLGLSYPDPQMIGFGSPPGSCSCQTERDIFPQIASKARIEWDASAIFATVRVVATPTADLTQTVKQRRILSSQWRDLIF